MEQAFRNAADTLYFDASLSAEPMNIRKMFLRSHALEAVIAGAIRDPPGTEEEGELVRGLVQSCTRCDAAAAGTLKDGVYRVAKEVNAHKVKRTIGKEELVQIIRDVVTELKIVPEIEVLLRKADSVSARLADAGGAAAPAGAAGGGGEDGSLAQAVDRSRERLDMQFKIHELHQARVQLEEELAHWNLFTNLRTSVGSLKYCASSLSNLLDDVESRMLDTQARKEMEQYQDGKRQSLEQACGELDQKIETLEQKRDRLQAELAEVSAAIDQGSARKKELAEERRLFDESNAESVNALWEEEKELIVEHDELTAETGAVASTQKFIVTSCSLFADSAHAIQSSCRDALNSASEGAVSAATEYATLLARHLEFLLRKLYFCKTELESMVAKAQEMEALGMEAESKALLLGQDTLQAKYIEAEAAILSIIDSTVTLREKAVTFGSPALNTAFDNLQRLDLEFKSIERPPSVPPQENPEEDEEPPQGESDPEGSEEKEPAAVRMLEHEAGDLLPVEELEKDAEMVAVAKKMQGVFFKKKAAQKEPEPEPTGSEFAGFNDSPMGEGTEETSWSDLEDDPAAEPVLEIAVLEPEQGEPTPPEGVGSGVEEDEQTEEGDKAGEVGSAGGGKAPKKKKKKKGKK